MKVDQVALRRRMAQLSVEELTRILEVDSQNYNEEALAAAAEELKSRETPEKTLAYRPAVETTERYVVPALPSTGRRPASARTWRVVALVGTAVVAVVAVGILTMERRRAPAVERQPAVSGDRPAAVGASAQEAGLGSSAQAARMQTDVGQTLEGCYTPHEDGSASSTPGWFGFRQDSTFVEGQVGRNVVERSGTYRIQQGTIELAYRDGNVRRMPFSATKEGGFRIGTVTFLPGDGCGPTEASGSQPPS